MRKRPGWAEAFGLLAGAALAVGMLPRSDSWFDLPAVLMWWCAVIVVVRSDIADFIIPDGASAAIAALGSLDVIASCRAIGLPWDETGIALSASWTTGLSAFALFWTIGWGFRRFGAREALGFGDVKLAGASAVWLDPADAVLALEVAALCAIALLVVGRRTGSLRDTAIPFGAFMAPAAWLAFVLGPSIRTIAGYPSW